MNRTKIEWCDYTWNPVTGCRHGCTYCYARRIAERFPNAFPNGFAPTFHPERLGEPAKIKKPSRIFVVSMGDLFGEWVPPEWVEEVVLSAIQYAEHRFLFLTKNPTRYAQYKELLSADNLWLGATATTKAGWDKAVEALAETGIPRTFISIEPFSVPFPMLPPPSGILPAWIIIGAQTGPGSKPVPRALVDAMRADDRGVPLFLKNNLGYPVKIQQYPEGLRQ